MFKVKKVGVFIVNFEHISLVLPLLPVIKLMFAKRVLNNIR